MRDRLKSLDFDLRALKLAEHDAWENLRAAERQTQAEDREKKYREAERLTTEMKASLEKAVKINRRLLELDEELKKADELFPLEQQILELTWRGYSLSMIGAALRMSTRSVEAYRYGMLKKFGVTNTMQMVRAALRHGILEA